jgi:hypothetical protein
LFGVVSEEQVQEFKAFCGELREDEAQVVELEFLLKGTQVDLLTPTTPDAAPRAVITPHKRAMCDELWPDESSWCSKE